MYHPFHRTNGSVTWQTLDTLSAEEPGGLAHRVVRRSRIEVLGEPGRAAVEDDGHAAVGLRPDECVLFDDSEYALLGARNAGLLSICVSNGEMESSPVADYTIASLEDFREDMLCV